MTGGRWKYAGAIAAMMAGCGVAVGIAMLGVFGHTITRTIPAVPFLAVAGAGAGLAGVATHWLFGRGGQLGMVLAFCGAVLATGLGAWVAGMIGLGARHWDLPLAAVVFSIGTPVMPLWLALMVLVQLAALDLRPRLT